jgi:ABC-2 type transport system ATP-binding protein
MTQAIYVEGLRKSFGSVHAVNGITLTVQQGEIFGLLGPNGAGKTTTIALLTGLARPDAGTIRILGTDTVAHPRGAQHLMGVVPDESNLYPELSGLENLCFCAALYGLPRNQRIQRAWELLHSFGLAEAAHRKFGSYSKGMKRKLTIAAGIIHRPPILFLDEPTTGIDVASARHLRHIILELGKSQTTIFLTTHYIEEAERLCHRIAFIVGGQILRTDTMDALLEPEKDHYLLRVVCTTLPADLDDAWAKAFPQLHCVPQDDHSLEITGTQPIAVGPIVRFLEDLGAEVLEAQRRRFCLEDVFVRETGLGVETMDDAPSWRKTA